MVCLRLLAWISGTYYLTETQAPSGYNTLTDPIKVELTATTVNNQTWDEVAASALTELSVKAVKLLEQ